MRANMAARLTDDTNQTKDKDDDDENDDNNTIADVPGRIQ